MDELYAYWAEHDIEDYCCFWCGAIFDDDIVMHIDHRIALANGGDHARSNLVPSCQTCNCRKGTRDPDEFAAMILDEIISAIAR